MYLFQNYISNITININYNYSKITKLLKFNQHCFLFFQNQNNSLIEI
jgi:hypothetical protein